MQRIPKEFINDLLSRIDLVQLIETRILLKKAGHNFVACCPFHDEKTPSFNVSPRKQFYHCFGCGVSGNAISFLMDYDRMSFIEAIEALAHRAGVAVPKVNTRHRQQAVVSDSTNYYQLMHRVAHFYYQQLKQTPQAIDYLKQRGLTGAISKTFQIGFAPAKWDSLVKQFCSQPKSIKQLETMGLVIRKDNGGFYDRFRGRIMFPIRDVHNRIIAFGGRVIDENDTPKYLNSPQTPIFNKGRELYGLYEAMQNARELASILIVEGYMDVVALAQLGMTNVVATLGTATRQEHIRLLTRFTRKLYFCFDGDKAGRQAAWRALEATLPVLQEGLQVHFVFLPEASDPDTLIRTQGKGTFSQLLEQAFTLPDFLLQQLQQKIDTTTLEGRAQLAQQGASLIAQIPVGILQDLLMERLSRLVFMPVERLVNLTMQTETTLFSVAKPQRRAPSSIRLVLALLIQNPSLVKSIENLSLLSTLELAGGQLLYELATMLKEQPELTTGQLLELWRNKDSFPQVSRLAAYTHYVPKSGIVAEFKDALRHIMQQNQAKQVEQLLNKANQQGLSAEEKKLLNALIQSAKSKVDRH